MQSGIKKEERPPAEAPVDVAALQAENESLRDRMLRALAETENVRRRAGREVEDARQYAISDFARDLLAVADNLQRAIAAAQSHTGSASDSPVIEGIRATQQQLAAALDRFGVRKLDALRTAFDPARHEAVMEVEEPEQAPGSVVEVVEDGYTINDRLLRPARVIVAKRPSEPSADSPG